MYTKKICIALGKSSEKVGPWGLCFPGEMRGRSGIPAVTKEGHEVPDGAFAQPQAVAVLRRFSNSSHSSALNSVAAWVEWRLQDAFKDVGVELVGSSASVLSNPGQSHRGVILV